MDWIYVFSRFIYESNNCEKFYILWEWSYMYFFTSCVCVYTRFMRYQPICKIYETMISFFNWKRYSRIVLQLFDNGQWMFFQWIDLVEFVIRGIELSRIDWMEETELIGAQLASTMWLAWLGVRQKEKARPYTVQRSVVNRLSLCLDTNKNYFAIQLIFATIYRLHCIFWAYS